MVVTSPLIASKQQLSRIRHRHLNCFLEAARTRKISAAALGLSISQPAASKTLAKLEEILDTKLFERGGRGGLRGVFWAFRVAEKSASHRRRVGGVLLARTRSEREFGTIE